MKVTNLLDANAQDVEAQKNQFAIDVLMGLCSVPKSLPTKYFYDDEGSKIFQNITGHDDYYLTNAEKEIFAHLQTALPEQMQEDEIDILELGAGDGHKSHIIIQGYLDAGCKVNYYPIDISKKAMDMLEDTIQPHKNLAVHGVIADYFDGMRLIRKLSKNRQLVLFLGSNIGNFDRIANQGFLRKLWLNLNPSDYLLIGFDLKKDIHVLNTAYNDSSGLTEAFNFNLLERINRELGGDFDVNKFQHFGSYNPILGAMESYVLSTEAQEVNIAELERSFHFEAYEPIHLEYSFKFQTKDIEFLSDKTGFNVVKHFFDSNHYFVDSLWKVVKD